MAEFFRCNYIDDSGMQCDTWSESKICVNHTGIISPRTSAVPGLKEPYMEVVNAERALVYKMSLEEIDAHIAGIDKIIELERTKLLTSRAVRSEKIDKLSDEERAVRRATTASRAVSAEKRAGKSPKATSIKKDPVQYLMDKYGLDRPSAEKLMGGI